MSERVNDRRRNASVGTKRKRGANDKVQCSDSKSSSEDSIHTIWTDDSKNFGLRVKIEGRLLNGAEFIPRNRRFEPPVIFKIYIQGV